MGCDIHLFVERRNGNNWVKVGKKFVSSQYDRKSEYFKQDRFKQTDEPYKDRNYLLFAILAGVRNKYGIKPINPPRGIPKTVSKGIKKEYEEWGCDGHTPSYYTLKELLEFDWNKEILFSGVVGYEAFLHYLKTGKPNMWCESRGGNRLEIMTPQEMERMIKANYSFIATEDKQRWATVVIWKEKFSDYCKGFINHLFPQLEKIAKPEDVRIVFWFDN